MEFLKQLVELLERGGPWTITAVCMLITGHLYRELRAVQAKADLDKQALNDRLNKATERLVEVVTVNNETQKQLISAVRDLED